MEAGTGKVDDLAALAKLTEQTLLKELELRYGQGQIYASLFSILIHPFLIYTLFCCTNTKHAFVKSTFLLHLCSYNVNVI